MTIHDAARLTMMKCGLPVVTGLVIAPPNPGRADILRAMVDDVTGMLAAMRTPRGGMPGFPELPDDLLRERANNIVCMLTNAYSIERLP